MMIEKLVEHHCHAEGCTRPIPAKMFMCYPHWRLVPDDLKTKIYKYYRPGQEIDKRASPEYLEVTRQARLAVRAKIEGTVLTAKFLPVSSMDDLKVGESYYYTISLSRCTGATIQAKVVGFTEQRVKIEYKHPYGYGMRANVKATSLYVKEYID